MLLSGVAYYHQIKPYLNSVDDNYEFHEIESYVHLYILDNERENVPRLQFLNCSYIMDLVLSDYGTSHLINYYNYF